MAATPSILGIRTSISTMSHGVTATTSNAPGEHDVRLDVGPGVLDDVAAIPQSATARPMPDVRPALAGLPIPTLIRKGSCDYLSRESAMDYRGALPNSTLHYLDGAGHNTYQDRPDVSLAAIPAFLTGGPADRPG